jgi:cellulose synthase/poly-beta-1,6-N-acetylglucosamine synthase-like glycosyltransferase
VLEEDDLETVAAARALEGAAGTAPFEIVEVPPGGPRTKPKAANYALAFARGDYLVVYDAEDRPEPDQLRKAVATFRAAPRSTACLQARLNFYNADYNWLTRMFALDYSLWFDALLPGLDSIGVPMPLGGTSNHFRTAVLRDIGGWDAFNVTEDADIGIRLAQLGYRVSMLDSTTFEEAPIALDVWLRQRSRWLKGYMQTWLVHMRDPVALVRRTGISGFLAFQLFIGGGVVFALVNPPLWLAFIAALLLHQVTGAAGPGAIIPGAGLLACNVLLTWLAVMAPRKRGWDELAPYGLTVIVYWALVSAAGYRGIWQLVTRPFFWENPARLNKPMKVLCNPALLTRVWEFSLGFHVRHFLPLKTARAGRSLARSAPARIISSSTSI